MASPGSVQMQLGVPDLTACRHIAVKQIDRVQTQSPANQLVATAIALVAMAEAAGIDPFDAVVVAKRAMSDAEGPFTHQIQAVRAYAAEELRRA